MCLTAARLACSGTPGSLRSLLQLCPNLSVTFGRPDPRPIDAIEFIPEALDVERQAVLEDWPMPKFGRKFLVGAFERRLQGSFAAMNCADLLDHAVQEFAGLFNRRICRGDALRNRTSTTYELVGSKAFDDVQSRRGPVHVKGVAGVQRRLGFYQIACKQRPRSGMPGNNISRGVTAAAEAQFEHTSVATKVDVEPLLKRLRRSCQSRNARGILE